MHPRILHRVVDATDTPTAAHLARFTHTPAILSNFCRHKVKKCDYPGIVAEAGKTVRGVYVAGLNENDMLRLDRFEGSQYVKEDVEVELLRGESLSGKGDGTHENPTRERELVKTQTYVFEDRQDLEDEEWDFEKFKKEKLQNWVGSTDEYDGMTDHLSHLRFSTFSFIQPFSLEDVMRNFSFISYHFLGLLHLETSGCS